MNRSLVRLTWAAIFMVVVSTAAFAQGGGVTSSLSGTVVDAQGGVIPGASVAVKNNATGVEYTAVTAEQGSFTIPAIDAGTYTVTISLMGFKTAVLNNVVVNAAVPAAVKAIHDTMKASQEGAKLPSVADKDLMDWVTRAGEFDANAKSFLG